jgi:hypothetical protein
MDGHGPGWSDVGGGQGLPYFGEGDRGGRDSHPPPRMSLVNFQQGYTFVYFWGIRGDEERMRSGYGADTAVRVDVITAEIGCGDVHEKTHCTNGVAYRLISMSRL